MSSCPLSKYIHPTVLLKAFLKKKSSQWIHSKVYLRLKRNGVAASAVYPYRNLPSYPFPTFPRASFFTVELLAQVTALSQILIFNQDLSHVGVIGKKKNANREAWIICYHSCSRDCPDSFDKVVSIDWLLSYFGARFPISLAGVFDEWLERNET